jgi:hypothetical protein
MTSPPVCVDPASDVIDAFKAGLLAAYDVGSACPPDGLTATPPVYFFGGESAPLEAWNAHSTDPGCDVPFLWVRFAGRYQTRRFPEPVSDVVDCDIPSAMEVEIGAGWCCVIASDAAPADYAVDAEKSLINSWRIERARCAAMATLRAKDHKVAIDLITPYGPEGGIMAWMTLTRVSI